MAYKVKIQGIDDTQSFVFNQKVEKTQTSSNDSNSSSNEKNSGLLLHMSLDKKMYEPSRLEVVLQVDSSVDFKKKLITLSDGTKDLTNKYYIFNVKQTGNTVTLIAYSADKFLTKDKFCQAFTGKKMVEDIITKSLEDCSSPSFEQFRKIVTANKNGKMADFINKNVKNFLKDKEESIIPYAVQYNESFYDFMVRMCNRDGEFLYMDEDNKLCIGLKSDSVITPDFKNNTLEYLDCFDELDKSDWLDNNYLGKLQYRASYDNDTEKPEQNKDEEAEEEKAKEKLDYISNIKDVNKSLYQNFYVLAPEYLEEINFSRGNFCCLGDYTSYFTAPANLLGAFANERTSIDASVSCAKLAADKGVLYAHYIASNNKKFNDKYRKDNPKNANLYSTRDAKRNNSEYNALYTNLEKAKANQIRVVGTNIQDYTLGNILNISGKNYVVYQVTKKSILVESENYKEEFELLLVTNVDGNYYPLPMPEIRIKKVSAQRAIVVDNCDPSRLGRVRVKYPWQSAADENSTPWIRISNPMASNDAGFFFIPNTDDEVLIDYEDANIERPYVCGAFYNDTNRPSIPAQSQNNGIVRSITSAHGHHISFSDAGDASRLAASVLPITQALGKFGTFNDILKSDEAKYYSGGFEISDYYGIYSITGSTHDRSINVSSPFGDVSIDAFTGITINAPLGDVKIVGKNVSIEARNNLTLKSGTNIEPYHEKEKFKNGLKFACFDKLIENTVDISLFRNFFEMLLRPIGGTMLIKSRRYMRIEAGKGETQINRQVENADFHSLKHGTNRDVMETIDKVIEDVNAVITTIDSIYSQGDSFRDTLSTINCQNQEIKDIILSMMTDKSIIDYSKFLPKVEKLESTEFNKFKTAYTKLNTIRTAIDTIYEGRKLRTNLLKSVVDNLWKKLKVSLPVWDRIDYEKENINKKQVLYEEVKTCIETEKNLKDLVSMVDYKGVECNLVNDILDKDVTNTPELEHISWDYAKSKLYKDTFKEITDDRVWASVENGAILISDNKDKFFKMDNDGKFSICEQNKYSSKIKDKLNSYFPTATTTPTNVND